MPSGRGAVVLAAGLGLWAAARIAGSPTLHIVAVGLALLPIVASVFTRWSRQRLRLRRRLSDQRVMPGQRVSVELEIQNESPASTSFLLLEDRIPAGLGRPARLVVTGIAAHATANASYSFVPQSRGRYTVGPMIVHVSDPFALTRSRVEFSGGDELIVTPMVEDLDTGPSSPFGYASGFSLAKHLFRSGEDFYTMRQYQEGDDLRRIHWRSVARSGQLMIRQDESTRRSGAILYVDTRQSVMGPARSPAFEAGVSAAASIGVLLASHGFTVRLCTPALPPAFVTEDQLLDALAGISHDPQRASAAPFRHLRTVGAADTTLVLVTAPPEPAQLTTLIRSGGGFGAKLAVLVYPIDPATLPDERREQLEGRASSARLSLSRSGWEVLVLPPGGSLKEVWQRTRMPLPALSG